MLWCVRQWAKQSSGCPVVHNPKLISHYRDCPKYQSHHPAPLVSSPIPVAPPTAVTLPTCCFECEHVHGSSAVSSIREVATTGGRAMKPSLAACAIFSPSGRLAVPVGVCASGGSTTRATMVRKRSF